MQFSNMTSDTPLYKVVQRRILEALTRGKWKPGERLPSEAELSDQLGVSVSTLRAGVSELAAAGVLVRRQGKGTFVAQHHREGPQFRFSNIHDQFGKKVRTTREITAMRRVRADLGTMKLLMSDLSNPPQVHLIDAFLKIDGKPLAVLELILPCTLFPKLKQQDFDHSNENLYALYQSRYGITVLRMEERVSARTADRKTAKILGLALGHPLLLVERVAYSFNNQPVEIRRRMYEGLAHHYLFTHESLD